MCDIGVIYMGDIREVDMEYMISEGEQISMETEEKVYTCSFSIQCHISYS